MERYLPKEPETAEVTTAQNTNVISHIEQKKIQPQVTVFEAEKPERINRVDKEI